MRKRYGRSEIYPGMRGGDVYPLAMGDGTFVLISGLEYLRGITPNEILAQEAQEVAAQPNVLPPPPWWRFFRAPVSISGLDLLKDTLAQPSEESVQSIDNAMKRIAENTVPMPSEIPDAAEDAKIDPEYLARNLDKKATRDLLESIDKNSLPMPAAVDFRADPERASEVKWFCFTCRTGGSAKDQTAADAAVHDHRESPEHDRAMEAGFRDDVEAARLGLERSRAALYDYLKSKGRVA